MDETAYGHGLRESTAEIKVLENRLVTIKVQFNLIDYLNSEARSKSPIDLEMISVMPEGMFESVYASVTESFLSGMQVFCKRLDGSAQRIHINARFPSAQQAKGLIKRERVEKQYSGNGKPPYTYSDRRFFQVFNFDFRLAKGDSIDCLRMRFPSQLADVFTSFSEQQTRHVAPMSEWSKER